MGTFSKIKKYSKPSLEINEKIKDLDRDLKKTLGEAIANSTSGVYSTTGFAPGDAAIPPIPEVPPTYEDVTGGLGGDGGDFSWPDQGDGNPDNSPIIPSNLYTTYNGEAVPALRYIETYNGETLDYGDDLPIGAVAFRDGWLGWNYLGYLGGSGIRGVGTTRFPNGDIGNAIYAAYNNWPFPGRIVKQVYQWEQIDCLFGSCKGGSQYYPSGSSSSSSDGSPLADRVLYTWTVWLPADADGNLLKNRILTDPGSPAVPGVPEGPPKLVVLSRNELGDPNYYPGDPSNFLMGLLNLGKRGYDYIRKAMSDRSAARATPPPPPPPNDPDEPEIPPGGAIVKTESGYAVLNAKQLAAYRAGGGESAINSGKSFQSVMKQGYANTTSVMVQSRGLTNIIKKVAGEGSKIFNGVTDGLQVLSDVKSAIKTAEKYGGLKPPKQGEDRPTLIPGVPGSKENPVPRTLSSSTNKTLVKGINRNMTGPELRRAVQNNINTDFNFGAKGTLNNLTSDPYFNEKGDLVIDDTYAFDAGGDVGKKPFLFGGTTGDFAKSVSGALVGSGGKYEKNRVELEKDILTKFDQSIGAILPGTPGRKDPLVNIRIVIPASQIKESFTLSEGWESPKHTNIEKNQKNRWFNPNDIAPEYPKEPPASMVGGYSSKSLLAPKPIDREPVIKITKKDLARNHKFTDAEIKDLMDTINRINAFLAAHPEELIHAQKRYPKDDTRLAELNWKMDQMLSASEEYIETQFPENQRLFNKVQQAVKRSIKLTDPKTYKDVKDPQTVYKLLSVDYVNEYERPKRKLKLQSRNKKTAARFLKKPRIKTRSELIDEKIIQLENDMKKTGMGA